jgi:hypothetical protein
MTAAAVLKLQRAEQLATKADLAAASVAAKADLAAAEARLEIKIEQSRADTIKWVISVGFAQAATILAVLQLFPGHP